MAAIHILSLGLEYYLLIGLLIALSRKKGKSYLTNIVPFVLAWMLYDITRGIADNISPTIHTREIYYLELKLFGWMFGDQIPSFWAQKHQNDTLLVIYAVFYLFHFAAPFMTAIVILYKSKDEEMFREYVMAFLLTSYAALITFIIFPVAPPWYVYDHGFVQPTDRAGLRESAANLISVDKMFQTNVLGDFYATFNYNAFAAFPSLHAGYSYLVAYYLIREYYPKVGKWALLAIIYPIGVWSGAVYLNHHFIVDLLAGMLYAYTSIRIVRYLRAKWKRKKEASEKAVQWSEAENPEYVKS